MSVARHPPSHLAFIAYHAHHRNKIRQHCKRTKALLEKLHLEMDEGWKYDTVNLDLMPGGDGPRIQDALLRLTGQRTVPNIFVGGTHVGGNSDLQALHHRDQGLTPMLQALAVEQDGEDL